MTSDWAGGPYIYDDADGDCTACGEARDAHRLRRDGTLRCPPFDWTGATGTYDPQETP